MNARQFLSAIATTAVIVASVVPIFGKVEFTSNNNSIIPGVNVSLPEAAAAGYMDDYFANGNIISLNNYGQFLNLHFLKKGGMIQSSNADGTDDQKFRVIRKDGTNQIQLERINSDRMIITPSAYTNQAPLEAWQRNLNIPFHPMQTWYVDVARTPGTFWLKPLGAPQFALNLPYGRNNVKSTLANFDPNDRDMEWNVQIHSRGNGNPAPQPQPVVQPQTVQPIPQPIVTPQERLISTTYQEVNVRYQAVLISARAGSIEKQTPQVGHSIFAAVKNWEVYKIDRYSSGRVLKTQQQTNMVKTTVSSPGYQLDKTDNNSARVNSGGLDDALFKIWKDAGNSPRKGAVSFRTLTINADQYRTALSITKDDSFNNYRELKCEKYAIFAKLGCNCTTVSTKIFKLVTNENFQSENPTLLSQEIDKSNQLGDWWTGPNKNDWLPIRF